MPATGGCHCVHDPRLACSYGSHMHEIFINLQIQKALGRTILLSLEVNILGQPSSERLRNEDQI